MNTPAKLGSAATIRQLRQEVAELRLAADNATIVANAFFWKTGMRNRDDCKSVVDAYVSHMQNKIAAEKVAGGYVQFKDNFIDPVLLAKVAEHTDSE